MAAMQRPNVANKILMSPCHLASGIEVSIMRAQSCLKICLDRASERTCFEGEGDEEATGEALMAQSLWRGREIRAGKREDHIKVAWFLDLGGAHGGLIEWLVVVAACGTSDRIRLML